MTASSHKSQTPSIDDPAFVSARRLLRTNSRRHPARWAIGALLAGIATLLLPWQQSVQGTGELTALTPAGRAGSVQAIVGGAIAEWHVGEGDSVRSGQALVTLREVKEEYLDPAMRERYAEQLRAKEQSIVAKRAKLDAIEAQRAAIGATRDLAVASYANSVARYTAALDAALADSAVALDQLQRRERLTAEGLSSVNDLQAARLRYQQAVARTSEKRNELANGRIAQRSVHPEYGEKQSKADADRATTLAEVREAEAEVSKLRNAIGNLSERAARFVVRAPQDGIVVQATRAGIGEQVKAGDALISIQPARPRMAVAMRVRAMDVPLLRPGRAVRLQFDGWPALQLSGWPRAAVGTFGGIVSVIDQVGDANGAFRVLVTPDPSDEPWPPELRQGSGVIGWAMLDEVRLGYELWRLLNGFPQSLAAPPADVVKPTGGKAA